MKVHGSFTGDRERTRRDLLRQYVRLQRELIEGDPAGSSYQGQQTMLSKHFVEQAAARQPDGQPA